MLIRIVLLALLTIPPCLAQKIPVAIVATERENQDEVARHIGQALYDETQLSGVFVYWTNDPADLPSTGIRLRVVSIRVTLSDDQYLGSAVMLEATRASAKDHGYYKQLIQQVWMLPKNSSVTDLVHGFLAEAYRAA